MYECADDDDDADEIIGSLTSQLTQLPQPVVALYTAVKSHVVRLVNSALIFMFISPFFVLTEVRSCPSEALRASLGTFGDCRHGRKSLGGRVPQNLEWGTLMQIVPRFSKNTAQNSPKHAISSERKIHFSSPDPFTGGPQSSPPNQAFWVRLCVPHNSSQNYACAHQPPLHIFKPSFHQRHSTFS